MKMYWASLLVALLVLHMQPHEFMMWSLMDVFKTIKSLRIEKGYDMFYLGESLTLCCHKPSGFVGNVSFKYGNDLEPDELVDKINLTDACLRNRTITKDHVMRGSAKFQCIDESQDFFALKHINADYRPRNATNLQVVWLNKTALSIGWDFGGVHYKHAKVTATWRIRSHNDSDLEGHESDWKACTPESRMKCSVSNVTGFADNATMLWVRVNVTNAVRGDSAVHVFPEVKLVDHAKPLPVTQVNVTSLSRRSVEVSVNAAQPELNYTIAYNSTERDIFGQHDSGVKVTGMTRNKTWEVSGLHPHYTYHFDVRARFETGLRSDPPAVDTVFQMPEDAPASGPIIPPMGYHLDESRCSSTSSPSASTATAYIYFQDILPEDQNGILRNYTAKVEEFSITDTKGDQEPRTLTLHNLPCGRDFAVTVVGSTDVGESPPASLSVFAGQDVKDIVEKLHFMLRVVNPQKEVRAEWVPPPPPSPPSAGLSLFLYHCEAGQDNTLCQDAIQYVEVKASDGQHTLKREGGSITGMTKFGVAVLMAGSNTTSGIHFTRCVYNPTVAAGNPLRDLKAYQQNGDIEVQWSGKTCDKLVAIRNYVLEVCQAPDYTDCRNHTVDGSVFSYTVTGMETDREYRVRLWANTTSEPISLTSFLTVHVSQNSGMPSAHVPSEVALGIIFMVVILVGGSLVCCCAFRDKMKSKMSKFMPFIPELRNLRVMLETGNSGESWNSSSYRESEGGITNTGYTHSRDSVGYNTQRSSVMEAQRMEEEGERHEDSQPTPPALDHPTDHISVRTDVLHGAASHSSAAEADSSAKAETCGPGMDIAPVSYAGLQEAALKEGQVGIEEKGVDDDDDAGAVTDAREKRSLSGVLLAPVGSSSYVKHDMARSPCQSPPDDDGKRVDTPISCAQRDGHDVTLANEMGRAGRLGGESFSGMNGNDPAFASCPCILEDDDDDLNPSDDQSDIFDGITVPLSFPAVEVMGVASGEGCGGDQLADERTTGITLVKRGNEEDIGKEEEDAVEENGIPDPDGSGPLP